MKELQDSRDEVGTCAEYPPFAVDYDHPATCQVIIHAPSDVPTYQRLGSLSNQSSTLSMSPFMVGETAFSALGRLRVNSMTWSCGKATLISPECAGGRKAAAVEALLVPMSSVWRGRQRGRDWE